MQDDSLQDLKYSCKEILVHARDSLQDLREKE